MRCSTLHRAFPFEVWSPDLVEVGFTPLGLRNQACGELPGVLIQLAEAANLRIDIDEGNTSVREGGQAPATGASRHRWPFPWYARGVTAGVWEDEIRSDRVVSTRTAAVPCSRT